MTKIRLLMTGMFFAGMMISGFCQNNGLFLEADSKGELVIHHILEQGQTMYGISKSYGVEINELIRKNPDHRVDDLRIGQDILVPIQKDQICYGADDCKALKKIPVYYRTLPKDNLFRISRIYFNTSIDQIKFLNELKENNLSFDQTLLIGWLPYTDYLQSYLSKEDFAVISSVTPAEAEIKESSPDISEPSPEPMVLAMESPKEEESAIILNEITPAPVEIALPRHIETEEIKTSKFNPEGKKIITKGITAYWNKNSSSKKGYYLLHKTLPVNTFIQVRNPVTDRMVIAEVVGNIPSNIYAPEISLVVTNEVAQALGVIDKKFYVQIAYPQN